MLTDIQIKKLINQGRLKIDPFDHTNLRSSKYDIHLGVVILKPKKTSKIVNPSDPTFQPEYERIDISNSGFVLNPGDFVLGQTLELIAVDTDLACLIDGSTTFARLGLSIHQSSTFIPPGQDSHIITLELFNAGPWKIKLSYKLKVGKLIFFKTSGKNKISAKSYNRYNGQKETTGAIIKPNNQDQI